MGVENHLGKLREIGPRTIIYLYSGGKDSSLALLLTRDAVREYAEGARARVYMLYIAIPGNTHPLNAFAASHVMEWHRRRYGFEPVYRCAPKVFQEYMARYGLQTGARRWCYIKFKYCVIREFTRIVPKPILKVDGMSPRDSKRRSEFITDEFQYVEPKDEAPYWAWHPLYGFDGDPMEELRKHPEFEPVVRLYEVFGDSLNCVVCPYKPMWKYIMYDSAEDMEIVSRYVESVIRSRRYRKLFRRFNSAKLTEFLNGVWERG